jgi:hypothetical protein
VVIASLSPRAAVAAAEQFGCEVGTIANSLILAAVGSPLSLVAGLVGASAVDRANHTG